MNPADLAAIIAVNVVGAASPGPDVVLLTRMATRSRKHAMAANLGIHVGVLMWTSLTVFGAAALLTAFPWMLELIQVIGGSWIMYMGISAVRQGWRDRLNPPLDLEEAVQRLGSVRSAFTTGVATNLSNPKIVLFLAALVAPLLPTSPTVGVALTVIAALWLSSFLLFVAYCLLVSTDRVRRKLFHAGPYIDMGAGTFFIIAGTVLILRGLLGLAG
ncbi:LysE family translocator [Corynebacterium tuscaniense]|uniref:LysE family translocator n=1 Tax=Corynebacterium tuscaniense TaxID=302449 RepID=UPI00050F799B|nr:LysE family translocator [Corynebacterium tuscaniense]KGF22862.1 lysine transporter LysE [Corynebacterium tuscaniense DNF00037]